MIIGSWVALGAIYVRIFSYIVFGELLVSINNDIIEIVTTAIIGAVLLLFLNYGGVEYDRMVRYIEEEQEPNRTNYKNVDSRMLRDNIEMEKHWKIITVGSALGLFALVARTLFYFFTGNFPTIIGDEIVEIVSFALILSVFLWFIHIGIAEYGDIKRRVDSEQVVSSSDYSVAY